VVKSDILVKTKVFKLSNKKLLDYSNLACDLNDPNSCYFIGNYFLNDKNDTNDKLGMNFYKKSCKLGHAKGCYETGMKYYSKIVERKDYINVNKYLKKSCEGNFSFACFNLGVMHEKGLGIDKNLTNAKMYYNKACDMENMPAFVPIMFEMTVFFSAHLMVLTFYMRSKLWPFQEAHNPDPRTTSHMFLMEVAVDGNEDAMSSFLEETGAVELKVVEKN